MPSPAFDAIPGMKPTFDRNCHPLTSNSRIVLEICAPLASYDAGDRTLFPAHDIKAENFAQHGSKQIAVGPTVDECVTRYFCAAF
jgi:hypothetical protein